MENWNIKKILLPIDFSETSMNALNTAVAVARQHGAAVKLLFVHDNYDKYYPQINLNSGNDIIKALATLSKLVKSDDNVDCSFSYMMGDVSNCVMEVSGAINADLVVMGKHGNSGRKNKSAGSVVHAVAGKCKCPVLIVPSGRVWIHFGHILFPVRPTLSMIEKYALAKEIISKNNSMLYVLNLRNPSYVHELHIISRLVQLLKARMKEENIQTLFSYYFKDEKFVDKILSVAHDSENEIDLLVIASEDDNAAGTFSLYAQKIIHQANVPVLIMKPETIGQSEDATLNELAKQLNYNC